MFLKYSGVLFLESSQVVSEGYKKCDSSPISALRVASDTFCLHLFLSYIEHNIHSVMHEHYFKGILKCSLYKE